VSVVILLDVYEPKMVGMIWSMLAQEQTWFGNEPWKSYGIQVRIKKKFIDLNFIIDSLRFIISSITVVITNHSSSRIA
jgi:hypothetical protein